jgi:chromosome segregation ATPase
MPIEMPEDTSDPDKKWRFRKYNNEQTEPEEPVETTLEPAESSTEPEKLEEPVGLEEPEEPEEPETPVTIEDTEDIEEAPAEPPETVEVEDTAELSAQISDLNEQIAEIKKENKSLTREVDKLVKQVEEIKSKKDELTEKNTELTEELQKAKETAKKKTKKIDELKTTLSDSEKQVLDLDKKLKQQEKTAKEREEHLLTQLEAMGERLEKQQKVIKKRDEELVTLQKDILVKKDAAHDAQEEVDQLRTVGIVQREAVQDTTVLRRRATDLEVELEKLKKALEKDPKYRIYMLVRETGQRTLEELSKILGVGIFEARRRVQELVRARLLDLKEEKVTLARRK